MVVDGEEVGNIGEHGEESEERLRRRTACGGDEVVPERPHGECRYPIAQST